MKSAESRRVWIATLGATFALLGVLPASAVFDCRWDVGQVLNCRNVTVNNIARLNAQLPLYIHARTFRITDSRNLGKIDLDKVPNIRQFETVELVRSNLSTIEGRIPVPNNIKRLNVSQNALTTVAPLLEYLPKLRVLDISHNNITTLPINITTLRHLQKFYIQGNPINCTAAEPLSTWYGSMNGSDIVQGQESIICTNSLETWVGATYNLRDFFKGRVELQTECPPKLWELNCTCDLLNFKGQQQQQQIMGDDDSHNFRVNCSGRGLSTLPPVPRRTFILDISRNNISTLEPLRDSMYENVQKLFADDNFVDSLFFLSVASMKRIPYLSLRRNRIKEIPTHNIWDNLNSSIESLYLGHNYIQCNCNSARQLKVWLLQRNQILKDYNEIMCDSPGVRVIELKEEMVCQQDQDWSILLYVVVAIESALVILLVAKLIYDGRRFHKTGYLPWLSAKMPPLPCDCMLETLSPSDENGSLSNAGRS